MVDNLSPQQRELFAQLVEAARSLPNNERRPFFAMATAASYNLMLMHPGLPKQRSEIYPTDLEEFRDLGLVRVKPLSQGGCEFDLTARADGAYRDIRMASGDPLERAEDAERRLLNDSGFSQRHTAAYGKWTQAEQLLWGPDKAEHLTTIGHLCREATQEFATSLLRMVRAPDAPTDAAKTQARVQAVLQALPTSSETELQFLIALLSYLAAVTDLVQRQEHGAIKEGEKLNWDDARRVVLQTLLVLVEVDSVVHQRTTRK
jgi:hypothetical protein